MNQMAKIQAMTEVTMTENPVWVKCTTLDDSTIPKYQTPGSAGCDLCSSENLTIRPGKRAIVSTGLKMELPYGFEAQIRSRSGLAAKYGITVLNSPGTIDSDYRGEIKVILLNTGNEDFPVKKGDRIAQMVICQVNHAIFQVSEEMSSTSRGSGGFGSTGI